MTIFVVVSRNKSTYVIRCDLSYVDNINLLYRTFQAPISLHQEWQKTAEEATGMNVHMVTKAKKERKRKKKILDGDDEGDDEADNDSLSSASEMYILSWSNVSAYKKIIAEKSN